MSSDETPYDLDIFAEKHGVSREVAEVLLQTNGPSRERCDYAAEAFLRFRRMREERSKPAVPSKTR